MEFLYETHMHTAEVSACADSTAAEQVRSYKSMGYAGIIVTDHFVNGNSTCPVHAPWDIRMRHFASGFEAAKRAGDKCGLDVFFGWEFTIYGSGGLDFLTYGLDLDFLLEHPNVDRLGIRDYSALVRENGGYVAQAHPYREAWYINNSLPVEHRLLDGIEAFNAADTFNANNKALEFAEKHGLAIQAGSDSHSAEQLRYSGIKLSSRASDIFDIINALKDRKVEFI